MTRLGDIFESQIAGEWGSECVENENGTKVLRTTNFTQEGKINYGDVVIRSINQSKVEKKRLHYGDIILEKSGGTEKTPVGRVVFCDEAIEDSIYLCNNFTQAMRVNQAIAIPRYVFYFMWNLHFSGKTDLLQNKTTGIRNLQVKSYLNENCPLPALEEQRKIAAVLDKVSNLIAKRRQQLDKLDELVKSRFVEMFGDPLRNDRTWPISKLKLLTTKIGSGATPKGGKQSYKKEGITLVRSMNVHDGEFVYKDLAYIDTAQAHDLDNVELQPKDVFINITGASVARSCVIPDNILPGRVNQHVAIIRCKENLLNYIFLNRLFLNSSFKQKLLAMGQAGGATRQALTQEQLKKLNLILPPIELQNEFASFVQQVDKSKVAIQKSLDETQTLFDSLMQKYFS